MGFLVFETISNYLTVVVVPLICHTGYSLSRNFIFEIMMHIEMRGRQYPEIKVSVPWFVPSKILCVGRCKGKTAKIIMPKLNRFRMWGFRVQ